MQHIFISICLNYENKKILYYLRLVIFKSHGQINEGWENEQLQFQLDQIPLYKTENLWSSTHQPTHS